MGTSKHSNHSATGSATPTKYDNHSTVALGYRHAKEHVDLPQVDLMNFMVEYVRPSERRSRERSGY